MALALPVPLNLPLHLLVWALDLLGCGRSFVDLSVYLSGFDSAMQQTRARMTIADWSAFATMWRSSWWWIRCKRTTPPQRRSDWGRWCHAPFGPRAHWEAFHIQGTCIAHLPHFEEALGKVRKNRNGLGMFPRIVCRVEAVHWVKTASPERARGWAVCGTLHGLLVQRAQVNQLRLDACKAREVIVWRSPQEKKNRVVRVPRRASRYREASVVDLPPCRTKGVYKRINRTSI